MTLDMELIADDRDDLMDLLDGEGIIVGNEEDWTVCFSHDIYVNGCCLECGYKLGE